MKLPKKIKAKWLKALRSGEYKRATGTLHNPKTAGFCCLGVLQHCVSGGMVEVDDDFADEFRGSPSTEWYANNGIELQSSHTDWHEDNQEDHLMKMNDGAVSADGRRSRSLPFKKIANWIEKNIGTTD